MIMAFAVETPMPMKHSCLLKFVLRLTLLVMSATVHASTEQVVDVLGEELFVTRYPAAGEDLLIFFSSQHDAADRIDRILAGMAALGIEAWQVDIAESLFLPASTTTLRGLDGRLVAGLVETAARQTGKRITVMALSYGAIPVLRGVRRWQIDHAVVQRDSNSPYLNGAILLSPELYSSIPDLGLGAEYDPITRATNIPIVLLQAGKRSNRWQLDTLLQQLQTGGATVYTSILAGVTGLFYADDKASETQQALQGLTMRLQQAIHLLTDSPKPSSAAQSTGTQTTSSNPLDTGLRTFRGDPVPKPLNLLDISGRPTAHDDYHGKVTLVNFWASWCAPCIEEIPSLNRLRAVMQGKAFQLISINYAEERQRIQQFLTEVDVDYPVLLDADGRVSAAWNVLVFPSTFVIGPDGRIVYGVKGGILWDDPQVIEQLTELLDGK
jgi:thiol-disulfide isomerase/thioredoxin